MQLQSFFRAESESRELPLHLKGGTAGRGHAEAPRPCHAAQLPDQLATGKPRLRASLLSVVHCGEN